MIPAKYIRKIFLSCIATIFIFFVSVNTSFAHHIKGGWIGYTYQGAGSTASTSKYSITVNLYVSCTVTGPTDRVILGIFDATTHATIKTITINNTTNYSLTKGTFSACLSNPPSICYKIYTYTTTVELSNSSNGYILATQDAYRQDNLVNISNSGSTGITIYGMIPGGTTANPDYENNSPDFVFQDTAIVCSGSSMTIPFKATDSDGDQLVYSFGNGLNVSNASSNTSSNAPSSPPYTSMTYNSGYSGAQPMGSGVTIDPNNGLISGTAPSTVGEYVVAVWVKEYRNGVLIDSTKKELQIQVSNCTLTGATLAVSYVNCDNYNFTFKNENSASNISSYLWDFGVTTDAADTSTEASPTYTYADTGTFTLKLKVSTTAGCTDSTTSNVKVYPGFFPNFSYTGSCYQSPFQFTDASSATYGYINSWLWNFGDPNSTLDTSTEQNPSYTYSSPDTVRASLYVTSSKGCSGTITKPVYIYGKPDLYLPFTDTLICSIDSLQLQAQSQNATSFAWIPTTNIQNYNTATPTVYPKDTTIYTVIVSDKGCVDSATVQVNVVGAVSLSLTDTTACIGDTVILHPNSNALKYTWSSTSGEDSLNNYYIKNPFLNPSIETNVYHLIANIGKCVAEGDLKVLASAYPKISLSSNDTTICYGSSVQLDATTDGTNYRWLTGTNLSLSTTVNPSTTTNYIFMAQTPNAYCTKYVYDTAIVQVTPKIYVNAGNDTSVVINQPLQLHAIASDSSANIYTWTPAVYLDNGVTSAPIATFPLGINYQYYTVKATTKEGCYGADNIKITIFQTGTDILVPSGFTPNGDGKNDVSRPILVGIKKFNYFKIYNRWGQLVFYTTQIGMGWNGQLNGQQQPSGSTFIYEASGEDYNGHDIDKKGTIVLIR